MIELAALGFLLQEPLNGYRLKQKLELFMCGCVSANYGTIYPLLRRLEARGAISITASSDRGESSARKVYSITESGRSLWKQKMLEHPQESWVNAKSRFMIKVFFFTHLDYGDRLKLLKHRSMVCQLHLDELNDEVSCDPYQASLMQYGRADIQTEIQWLNQHLLNETTNLEITVS